MIHRIVHSSLQSHWKRRKESFELLECTRHGGGEAPVPGEVQGGRRGGGRPQRHGRPCCPDGHGQILRVGTGRAEPGDADAGLHARLLSHLRLRRRPGQLHGPREAHRVRRHVHGCNREGGRHRLPRRHRQATASGMSLCRPLYGAFSGSRSIVSVCSGSVLRAACVRSKAHYYSCLLCYISRLGHLV